MMGVFIADCFFRCHRNPPSPPREAIRQMLGELEDRFALVDLHPVALRTECWAVPAGYGDRWGGNVYGRITVEHAPGAMLGTLMRWYEWQHPRWGWASAPAPKLPPPPAKEPP